MADALASGASVLRDVGVQVPLRPQFWRVERCKCSHAHPSLRIVLTSGFDKPARISNPKLRHLAVDDRGIPTGESDEWPATDEALGEIIFDDGFDEVPEGAVFAVAGGGHRIEVT